MASYIPSTQEERQRMLQFIGCQQVEELFAQVPGQVMLNKPLELPHGLAEKQVRQQMEALANKNVIFQSIFRGAGAYKHYIPAAVKQITSKEEFITAYTPYQAEISQGLLQGMFEYQTMICSLTGMDASNASVYDGATAASEAVAMCKERKRTKALVSASVHPQVIQTIATYCFAAGTQMQVVPTKNGMTDPEALQQLLADDVACFYMQQPNYYGLIEDATALGEIAHGGGAKYIMGCNPIALAVLKTPAACGADIAVGEGQPLGLSLAFGGPYLGFMACTQGMVRKLPGRIVGETTDDRGNRAYVLTLQAREQHIRREKASSNICSNQALCALTASVYMSTMGPDGLTSVAEHSMAKAHYLAEGLATINGVSLVHSGPYFHEFVTTCPVSVETVMDKLAQKGILGGYPLSGDLAGCILWCATEENSKEEMDQVIAVMKEVCESCR